MKSCEFEADPDRAGGLRCRSCGRRYRPIGPPPYRANCGRWNPAQIDAAADDAGVLLELGPAPPAARTRPTRKPLTLTQKAASLARSLAGLAVDLVLHGRDAFVTEAQLRERAEICHECPEVSDTGNRCEACGCQLWAKQRARAFECPHGKWPRLNPETVNKTVKL